MLTHGLSAGLFQYMFMQIISIPSLSHHPSPHCTAKECQPWWQTAQTTIKRNKKAWLKAVTPPAMSFRHRPTLLTSINPHYCVVGGKGVDGGGLSNLILCDLGGGQWISGSQENLFEVIYCEQLQKTQWLVQTTCNREYIVGGSTEPGFKFHWSPRRTYCRSLLWPNGNFSSSECWCKKCNFTGTTSVSLWLYSVKL